jgi:hypothetical protein
MYEKFTEHQYPKCENANEPDAQTNFQEDDTGRED